MPAIPESCITSTRAEEPTHPGYKSSHWALKLTPSGPSQGARTHARYVAFPLLYIIVAAWPVHGAPGFWHRRQKPTQSVGGVGKEFWMAKHRGGRGRAKRRRCAFVVVEECGNVPAPCQTSLKGVRPHSAGVGKPARAGAHTGGCSCTSPSAWF